MTAATLTRGISEFTRIFPAKRRASALHASISFAIFLVLLYIILVKWYPLPYFHTDGGWQGVRLMFAIDVVLGPLLTFIVFNPNKSRREITFDLSFVAVVQLSVLAWGIHTVYAQRPVAIIEYDGYFVAAVSEDYAIPGIDLSKLAQYDDRKPPIIFERVPKGDELTKSLKMIGQGWAVRVQTDFYEPFREHLPEVFDYAANFEKKIPEADSPLISKLRSMREKYGNDIGFLPFNGRHKQAVLVLNRKGDIVDSILVSEEDVKTWAKAEK